MSACNSPDRETYEESSPLLLPTTPTPEHVEQPRKQSKPWLFLIVYLFFLVTTIDIASSLFEPPKTRVFEANICLRYYEKHDPSKINKDGTVDESLCKINAVQEKLATIMGWAELFEVLPGILLAVPYGALADKYGRKWIFALSLVGMLLDSAWILVICYFRNLPLQLVWLASIFLILGGGPIVASAVGLTIVSDIIPAEKRTSIFLYLTACILVAELISPIAAAALMKNGNWLPLVLAQAILAIAVIMAAFFPETLHSRDLPKPPEYQETESIELQSPHKSDGHGFKAQLVHLLDAVRFVRRDYTLALVVFSFLANRLGPQSLNLLIRYASQRYDWTIREASYLLSIRAAANFVALILIIPLVDLVLIKKLRMSSEKADLIIARGSIVLITASFLIMGISATPFLLVLGLVVYTLGTGYGAAMRSVSIAVAGGQSSPDIGRLMAVIAIVEGFGAMLSGPLLNTCLQWGMRLGRAFLGLPFILSASIFVLVSVVTFMISIREVSLAQREGPIR
jgi:MFS family permease